MTTLFLSTCVNTQWIIYSLYQNRLMNKRSEIKVPSNYQTNCILVSDSDYYSYFRVFHGFVHPMAGFGFVRQEQSIPITAWAKRRHAMHRLGTLLSLLCSQADTQFYSNKHEIDSKDQIQRACSWKCALARQGVCMRSLVCACVCAWQMIFVHIVCFSKESAISYMFLGWWLKQWEVR